MAIDNKAPEIAYLLVINEDIKQPLCFFSQDKNKEITHIKTAFYKCGSPTGKIKLRICNGINVDNIVYESDEVNISEIDADIFGDLRFDFNRSQVKKDKEYYLVAEIYDYVKDDDNWFSFALDYPMTVNNIVGDNINEIPVRVEILAR